MAAAFRRVLAEQRVPVLALALGLAAGGSVYGYLVGVARVVPVVLAAADLPAGATIGWGDIRVAHLPRAAVHPEAVSRPEEAVGQVLSLPVLAGEQVLGPRLAGHPGGGPGRGLAPGQRAFYLPLDPEGGYPADLVRPGDRLDLVHVPDGGPGRLLLAGAPVVQAFRERAGMLGGEATLRGLLLAVTPAQAVRLAEALAGGRVHLLLAGAGSPAPAPAAEGDLGAAALGPAGGGRGTPEDSSPEGGRP